MLWLDKKLVMKQLFQVWDFFLKANECHGVRYFETGFKPDPSEKETTYSLEV